MGLGHAWNPVRDMMEHDEPDLCLHKILRVSCRSKLPTFELASFSPDEAPEVQSDPVCYSVCMGSFEKADEEMAHVEFEEPNILKNEMVNIQISGSKLGLSGLRG